MNSFLLWICLEVVGFLVAIANEKVEGFIALEFSIMSAFLEIVPWRLFFPPIWGCKSISQDEKYQKNILNINSVKIFEVSITDDIFSSSLFLVFQKGFIIIS